MPSNACLPAQLPPPGSGERWPWLQRLRRQPDLEAEPWLRALEAGSLQPARDLVAQLVERLDGADGLRLLRWGLTAAAGAGDWLGVLDLLARDRNAAVASLLRQSVEGQLALPGPSEALLVVLLPLLGHQRNALDAPLLSRLALEPGPLVLRRAALEGLALGLSVWPLAPLRRCLVQLAGDLDPTLAAQAVDLLARLPAARPQLRALARRPLDPAVARRLERRLSALQASALVLVVHGRSGGEVPAELVELAAELERRRGSPVRLQALTAEQPPEVDQLRRNASLLTLVPLFLLPGNHVRQDLPAIAARWRRSGPVRRLPFLGSWPLWQRGLAEEVAAIAASSPIDGPPRLLHHPLEGVLAGRFLAHLEAITTASCQATPYSAADFEAMILAIRGPALPLALAANRLTDALAEQLGPPLLKRERLCQLLLQMLEDLP